jgi:hypothetical protein
MGPNLVPIIRVTQIFQGLSGQPNICPELNYITKAFAPT